MISDDAGMTFYHRLSLFVSPSLFSHTIAADYTGEVSNFNTQHYSARGWCRITSGFLSFSLMPIIIFVLLCMQHTFYLAFHLCTGMV